MSGLFDHHLPGWKEDPSQLGYAGRLPDAALRDARQVNRRILRELVHASTGVELDEHRLTIGFARRFATYKRANLVFSDLERLRSIGAGRIQFVFSGNQQFWKAGNGESNNVFVPIEKRMLESHLIVS